MTNKKLHIDEEDFTRYLENKMTGSERNAFEKELQKQPFDAEAFEGLNTILPEDLKNDLNEIKAKIKPRKQKNYLKYWAAAASVLLVVSAGIIWIQVKDQNMVSEMAEVKTIDNREILHEKSNIITEPSQLKNETEETTYQEVIPPIEKKQETTEIAETAVVENKAHQKLATKKRVTIHGVSQPAATDESLTIVDNNLDTNKTENTNEKNGFAQQNKKAKSNRAENYQILYDEPISSGVGAPIAAPAPHREIADSKAHPFGGFENYDIYLNSTALIPENYDAKKAVVKIKFIVDSTGLISEFQNRNSADTLLFSKAKEIILNGPKWSPEIKNGKPLNSTVKLKIVFRKVE